MYQTINHSEYLDNIYVDIKNTEVESYNMLTDTMQFAPLCDVIEIAPYQYSILESLCYQYI